MTDKELSRQKRVMNFHIKSVLFCMLLGILIPTLLIAILGFIF